MSVGLATPWHDVGVVTEGGDRRARVRGWLLTVLAAVVAFLLATLAAATNVATPLIPEDWQFTQDPVVMWSAVGVLVVLVGLLAMVQQRFAGSDPADTAAARRRVFGVIPRPARHFQTRKAEARRLREVLAGRSRAALVALSGARGAGKSQLAAAYARACVDGGFDPVAWINAESGLVTELAGLARELGLGAPDQPPEDLAARARAWLQEQARGRWLVVFDNVDDPDALTRWLPHGGRVKVLVTTSRTEFTHIAGFDTVPVGMFTPVEGRGFLLQTTGLPDDADADALGVRLGWLPLGLAQAGAYIAGNRVSYRQYLNALTGQNLDETLRRRAGADHPGVLKATQVSMAGLGRDDPSGDAARVLTVLTLLSPDGVRRALLSKAALALGLTGGVGHALDLLAAASLITLGGLFQDGHGRDAVTVLTHRLTARVIRHQAARPGAAMPLPEAITAAAAMLDLLTDDLPYARVAHQRAEIDELVAHIRAVREHTTDPPPLLLAQTDWAGRALREAGDLTRAVPLLEHTLTDRQRVLGADHPDTLSSGSNLAGVYRAAGRVVEAITLLERVLADCERVLGADHPDTLASRNNLAFNYRAAGRVAAAITLHEQVLTDRQRVLGADHPDTLASRNNLANAYEAMGRMVEAITLLERVLADRQRVLGADHPGTLASRNNLASAYRAVGRVVEAITLHEQILADCERVLGADHPDTLISKNNLAGAYRAAGRVVEAVTLLEQVLADCERVLGADHPNTLAFRNNLASAYDPAGRAAEAITLLEQVLADDERVLGADHPNTLISKNNLASAYEAAGRVAEAITLHEQALADDDRVLGADHPDTLASRNNLAGAYRAAGRVAEAIILLEQVLADRQRVLGADHPDTLASRNNLAGAYRAAGRVAEAIILLEQLVTDCERVLSAKHPITTAVRNNLTHARQIQAGR